MSFDELKQKLSPNLLSIVQSLVKGGSKQGHEYKAASIHGGKGDSFSFNIKTGMWADFATDHKGGDIISLYAAIHNISQAESFLALGGELPGKPSKVWPYKSPDGKKTIMAVARYDSNGSKTFKPWLPNGESWKAKFPEDKRPLFGLDQLASKPFAPVLIVEGEKAAEAAQKLAPDFAVVTWSGGAKSVGKTDFTPLQDRYGVLWPDADEAGDSAIKEVLSMVQPMWKWVKILDVSGKSEGWDAADALAEGMTSEKLYEWIGETVEFQISFSFKAGRVSEILSLPEPPLRWLIKDFWVDQSNGLIAGIPGVGKTWIAEEMLFSVATNSLCLGKYAVENSGPVLLVEEEGSFAGLSRRLHMLARGRGISAGQLKNFHHITRQFIDIVHHEKELIAYVKSHGIKFVVFDSLRQLHSVNENSSEDMKPILTSFSKLGLETESSVLLIHHLRKDNSNTGKTDRRSIFERLRGSSAIHAWRDCIIGVEGEEDSSQATCTFQFRDADSPAPISVKRHFDKLNNSMRLEALDLSESEDAKDKLDTIVEYVREHGPSFKDHVCTKVGGRKGHNTKLFGLAVKQGLLVKIGYKWDVPETAGTLGNVGNVNGG